MTVGFPFGAPSAVFGSSAGAGALLAVQVIVASGAYVPTAGANRARIRMVGGGGAGGGATGGTGIAAGGGAGAGGYFEKTIIGAIVGGAVVIGPGGAGGGNGGDTSVTINGVTYTARGGSGGAAAPSVASSQINAGGVGIAGGTVGDNSYDGAPGEAGVTLREPAVLTTSYVRGGNGASSGLGSGARGTVAPGNGSPGAGYGGGGSGASAAAATFSGGNGGQGVLFIEEYS